MLSYIISNYTIAHHLIISSEGFNQNTRIKLSFAKVDFKGLICYGSGLIRGMPSGYNVAFSPLNLIGEQPSYV